MYCSMMNRNGRLSEMPSNVKAILSNTFSAPLEQQSRVFKTAERLLFEPFALSIVNCTHIIPPLMIP